MPADSPENKCPDECPECGSEKRWPPPVWTDGESGVTEECWHPWHEKPRCPDCGGSGANEFGDAFNNPCQTCGGSGRINTSGGGKTDEERRPESPPVDPQCPDCGGMGSDEGGFRGGKKWKAICPSCGGSGRSPVDSGTGCEKHGRTDCEDCYHDALAPGTGTDEKDIYSLVKAAEKTLEMLDAVGYEDKYHGKGELRAALAPFRASVPSSPHETGRVCSHCRGSKIDPDGGEDLVPCCVCRGEGTTPSASSAAPTNSVPSRSDSEGEGLAARIEELELSLKQADEELARVTRAAVKGPDGYDYHWCPGVGWCPGCPPSAVPKEEA